MHKKKEWQIIIYTYQKWGRERELNEALRTCRQTWIHRWNKGRQGNDRVEKWGGHLSKRWSWIKILDWLIWFWMVNSVWLLSALELNIHTINSQLPVTRKKIVVLLNGYYHRLLGSASTFFRVTGRWAYKHTNWFTYWVKCKPFKTVKWLLEKEGWWWELRRRLRKVK